VDYPEYTFISVDRDEFIDLCVDLDIFGIPSFVAFNDGKELGRFVSKNRKTREDIEEFLNSLS
ncbi:thioredoxin family protein, partial [Microvirga sp. 3-52]|nr:thioredoxin family protein [Microvirga sp. 3-52]